VAELVKNSVALLSVLQQVNALAITNVGTTAKKIAAVPNILQYLMITDYPLIETP